ncbi:MAG: SDR family oxidoreductase [Xanthobacteraceae bacterium]
MSERPVAIVTGGSAGIGATICRRMLDADYEVVSLARRRPDWSHPALQVVEVDLTDTAATKQAAESVAKQYAIGTVIHNAGVIRPNLLPDVRQEDLHDLAQLHLGAVILIVQAVLPGMGERKFGRIVMMSSRAALGLQTRTVYSATKAGMIGMARTWALELAPFGITVNVVAPGPIQDTEMFREVIPAGSEREAAVAKTIPVGRLGRSDDVARAVMFFADPENSFITGQVLYVCGGASIASISL